MAAGYWEKVASLPEFSFGNEVDLKEEVGVTSHPVYRQV